jgi:hypothetical protein
LIFENLQSIIYADDFNYDTPIDFYHGAGFVPGWNWFAEEAGASRGQTADFTARPVAGYVTVKDTGQRLSGRTPAGSFYASFSPLDSAERHSPGLFHRVLLRDASPSPRAVLDEHNSFSKPARHPFGWSHEFR